MQQQQQLVLRLAVDVSGDTVHRNYIVYGLAYYTECIQYIDRQTDAEATIDPSLLLLLRALGLYVNNRRAHGRTSTALYVLMATVKWRKDIRLPRIETLTFSCFRRCRR